MKNFKSISTVFLLMVSLFSYSQVSYFIERDTRDTTRFRFCTYQFDQSGGMSKSCTPLHSADTTLQIVLNLATEKRKYIEAKPWEKDFAAIDTLLKRSSGKTYSDFVKESVSSSIAGSWTLNYDSTEVDIIIDKDLKVKGGTIKGTCEVKDGILTLKNVLPGETVSFKSVDKILTGTYRKSTITMKRSL